jgi:hypothetical protein
MRFLGPLGDFLFGKGAQIFDESGRVRHQFPEKKWIDWKNRFQDATYDWRRHGAQERISNAQPKSESLKS